MKKLLLFAFVTLLGITAATAQDVQFGVKGGLNFASGYGDNSDDLGTVTSFHAGIASEIPLSERFSFQPEILYSGQGYDQDDNTVKLDYLNIPLMGKYYLLEGFSLEAGPQIGFLLGAENDDIDLKDTFDSVDLGVNVGLGYKFDNGLSLGARYNIGISDIKDGNRNGVFQLSIGYFF